MINSMQIGKYKLDQTQEKIVKEDAKYILVTAGAGSGKTLTILGKIAYLVKEKKIKEEEILCISFTKAASKSLKNKIKNELNLSIPTYTFHKLALELMKEVCISYEISDVDLLDRITDQFFEEDILHSHFLLQKICIYFKRNKYNLARSYQEIKTVYYEQLNKLKKICTTFIRLMKCNNYTVADFLIFIKKIRKTVNYNQYKREKIILTFILNIYLKYQNYLKENEEIDFDDMLIKATAYLKTLKETNRLKYIIIDEYQDTSYIRFLLIKELLRVTNANLMVVGDDFQSIYKFTGCDVSLFYNFSNYFPNAKIMKLERTYRNSQELIEIAGKFIMKNKNQIRKKLYSDIHLKNPICIIKYNDIYITFLDLIKKLSQKENKKILILGRNNKDINLLIKERVKMKKEKIMIEGFELLDITYMTIHKSKGLESDIVIIINLIDNITGFPNKIKDEKITRLVTQSADNYPYSEERRLFYVALTRTKNEVYLLVPKTSPSIFVEELQRIL